MKNNFFFLKDLKSNITLMNDFINDNNVTLSTFFKKFIFDLMFN